MIRRAIVLVATVGMSLLASIGPALANIEWGT